MMTSTYTGRWLRVCQMWRRLCPNNISALFLPCDFEIHKISYAFLLNVKVTQPPLVGSVTPFHGLFICCCFILQRAVLFYRTKSYFIQHLSTVAMYTVQLLAADQRSRLHIAPVITCLSQVGRFIVLFLSLVFSVLFLWTWFCCLSTFMPYTINQSSDSDLQMPNLFFPVLLLG